MDSIRILCYGDSNTWGWNPIARDRYSSSQRWTGVLADHLGKGYTIIEEGLNGRTTVWDDPIEEYKSGKEYLIPCLETHKPIDLIILMLGTNDLKLRFSLSAYDIARGMETLVKIIQKSETGRNNQAPRILILAPPPVEKLTEYSEMFEGAREKSLRLPKYYEEVAQLYGCDFLDTATIVKSSDVDGIHLEASSHENLGKVVAKLIQDMNLR